MSNPYGIESDAPRVTRSQFVEDDKMIFIGADAMADGKTRVLLPPSASRQYVEDVERLLEQQDRKAEAIARITVLLKGAR